MVTSAQIRAARALLDWTVRDLAEKSGVHRNTITRLEAATAKDGGNVTGYSVDAICGELTSAGIEFIPENGGGAGVRLQNTKQTGD